MAYPKTSGHLVSTSTSLKPLYSYEQHEIFYSGILKFGRELPEPDLNRKTGFRKQNLYREVICKMSRGNHRRSLFPRLRCPRFQPLVMGKTYGTLPSSLRLNIHTIRPRLHTRGDCSPSPFNAVPKYHLK